jgi:hypothetical protein
VEELVYQCWINDLDATAAVQRITCIPTTTSRGVMFQQAASYFAIQHLMDLEDVDLCGRVSVKLENETLSNIFKVTHLFE